MVKPSHSKSLADRSCMVLLLMSLVWTLGCDAKKLEQPASPKEIGKDSPSAATHSPTRMRFSSVAKDSGISFNYRNGEELWLVAMIESNGGGVGWIDYDRDGRWDLFLPGGGLLSSDKEPIMVPNALYRQTASDSDTTHRFSQMADRARVQDGVCYSFGVAAGDYDADGFADLFITGYGRQQLLRNLGDGTFEDATRLAGFSHTGWSSSAAWFDADNDGDLDLYIAHYGVWTPQTDKRCTNSSGQLDRCAPADYVGESDELWINQGDGIFEDRSSEFNEFQYRGIGVLAADFDHDGDTDLYVSDDEDPNMLFDNQGALRFKEIAAQSGTALGSRSIVDGSMGLALGDFDGNLKPDMLVTNYQNEYCELYLNQGKQYFTLGTRSSGLMALGQAVVGWGTAFGDLDLDGDEDLLVIAGHTSRKPIKSSNLQKPYLLENKDFKRLVSVGESSGEFFGQVHAGRGMALADYDNDGDLDFAVSMIEQPTELLRNDAPKGNYLLVDLVGRQVNRDAIGAWLEIELSGGARPGAKLIRHRFSGGSYASSHAGTLHVGLGDATGVSKLTIRWPGGKTDSLTDLLPNQRICVIESPN
ncbi:MAG: CRTAC1 family protein [Pirellula sp.]